MQNPAVLCIRKPGRRLESPSVDFLMVLRKHLTSAELIDFNKPLSERIVEFTFKTAVPCKELETMSLVVELLPNSPNIILLDAERRVLSSFLPITPQHGIGEYDTYAFPNAGDKLSLEVSAGNRSRPNLEEISTTELESLGLARCRNWSGFRRENSCSGSERPAGRLVDEIRSMVDQVARPSHAAWIYTELPLGHILEQNDLRRLQKAILSPIELESLDAHAQLAAVCKHSRSREVSTSTNWKAGRCSSRRSCRYFAICAACESDLRIAKSACCASSRSTKKPKACTRRHRC